MFKMGSLFDGSGTFPYSFELCGVEPVWASEIEEFPIKVTSKRFPKMKHLGSILDINGADIEPVDVITFGSPCQDMSIAGKRDGLKGERSCLFLEAIRIIKEMREATNAKQPKYVLWENVIGAFSSNKGYDFHTVLSSLTKVAGENGDVPEPSKEKNGSIKWSKAGYILGDGYSVAWRTLDAQYWGVAQRRNRVFAVVDFGGGGGRRNII